MSNLNETRILGRQLARELSQEEMSAVSGGLYPGDDKCYNTACNKSDGNGWVPDDWSHG